jgi:hypothetical protein
MGKLINKTNTKNKILRWLKTPTAQVIGIVIGIFTIFSMGFGAGVVIERNNSTLEKIQMNLKFNEQLAQEREKCVQLKIEQFGKKVNDLETVVNEIKKMKHGK